MPWDLEKEWDKSEMKAHYDYAGGPYPYPKTADQKAAAHKHNWNSAWEYDSAHVLRLDVVSLLIHVFSKH